MARKTINKEKIEVEAQAAPPTITKKPRTKAPAKTTPAEAKATKKNTLAEVVEAERASIAEAAQSRKRATAKKPAREPEPAVEPEAKAPRIRVRRSTKAAEEPGTETGTKLPQLTWRRSEKAEKPARRQPEAAEQDSPSLAPRKSPKKRRADRREIEITAEVAPKPKARPARRERAQEPAGARVEEPQIPEAPRREPVPTPAGGALVVPINGVPTLVRGNEAIPPILFFASSQDEDQLATVIEQVRLASENGIHLFSFLVELTVGADSVDDSVMFAAYLVKKVAAIDPQAKIILRTVFVAAPNWERAYPDSKFLDEDGKLADPSLCESDYWLDAEQALTSYIGKLRRIDQDRHIIGVHLERGEWFLAESTGYDRSVAARKQFQFWLRHRYRNDVVSLRAAWFDGSVSFDTVDVPEHRSIRRKSAEFVRTDRKTRPWVDYHLFISDATCERIAALAHTVKSASEGHYLVGVSYGYTFEWSHPASGHLSLGKLLRCAELDYIAGPPSYKNREPGGTAPFPSPLDSFVLNGKLYLSEDDYKTPISGHREPDDFNPVMKTPQALGNVHWRGAGAALAHSGGVCWMDSWGNGWLNSRGIWERAQAVQQALVWRLAAADTPPDVAVFVDERSLAYLADERAFDALVQNVRESVLRSGLSVGFYLLSDLAHRENFPDCKVHVFVNAWDMRPEVRSAIKTRLQRDGKVLFWLYCAGLFEGGRESLERAREVTGIALKPQPFHSKSGTTLLNGRDPLCQNLPEQTLAEGGRLEPSYFAIPEDADVLAEYTQTGLPSFVARTFEGDNGSWHSVFLGEPIVTPGLFRSLGQLGRAHVWSFHNDVVHARAPFLTVHCTGTAPRTLALPDKWTAYNIIEGEWAVTDGNSLKFQGLDGTTHSFLVGMRTDIEALLASDPTTLLKVDDIEPREDNSLHWDIMRFDVPIMKLDEWVEETWSEDLADDLLIKPSMIDATLEESEAESEESQRSRGRRRRRRRGHDDRGQADKAEDMAINVMFRKKE